MLQGVERISSVKKAAEASAGGHEQAGAGGGVGPLGLHNMHQFQGLVR